MNFDIIVKNLKKSENSSNQDQRIFKRYSDGDLSLEQCKSQFFVHNKIKNQETRQSITDEMFKGWLETIGYVR